MHNAGLLGTRFSRIVLSVAVIEDIVVYVILAVAVGLVQTSGSTAFGLPTALNIHTVAQSSTYHTIVAVISLAMALTVGGRVYQALARTRANPLARRYPVAFQLLWMLALSAGALALGLVPLYGAFVAGITVAVATASEIVPERKALSSVSFGFFILIYFAIIGLQLDLIHHFAVVFFLAFLAFACGGQGRQRLPGSAAVAGEQFHVREPGHRDERPRRPGHRARLDGLRRLDHQPDLLRQPRDALDRDLAARRILARTRRRPAHPGRRTR